MNDTNLDFTKCSYATYKIYQSIKSQNYYTNVYKAFEESGHNSSLKEASYVLRDLKYEFRHNPEELLKQYAEYDVSKEEFIEFWNYVMRLA